MPYPVDPPMMKHDLLCPELSSSMFVDAIGLESSAALFQRLNSDSDPPKDLQLLSRVYTYRDAPNPPLSRTIEIYGAAPTSVSAIRKLVGDDEHIPSCLHPCTVAVKRADERHVKNLKPEDVQASYTFAKFMRKLRKEGVVAITGPDKYGRFGILQPTEDICIDGEYEAQDFSAMCYVGKIDAVRSYLTEGISRPSAPPSAAAAPADDGFWKPPGEIDSGGDDGFWQPPGDTSSNPFDFNSAAQSDSNPWKPDPSSNYEPVTNGGGGFHADAGAAAADRFYSGLTRTLDTRADSRLFHMRAFNGWVKATQIQELDPKVASQGNKKVGSPLRVLDLACGKGGDLGKWVLHPRGIRNYVGIDVARGSLVDAAIRARKMGQKSLKRCTFTCADLGADVPGRLKSPRHKHMQKLSTWSLQREPAHSMDEPEFKLLRGGGISLEDKFDVVSIQFAIHYMMQTKKRARRFFQTVSELLEIGGNLIATTIDARVVISHLMNLGLDLHFDDDSSPSEPATISVGAGACRIRFEPDIVKQIFNATTNLEGGVDEKLFGLEYTFTLVEGTDHASGVGDAVNLPEWLIPIPVLKALAKDVGLELDYAQNFHEFFSQRSDPSVHAAAHGSMYNMKVLNRNGSISLDEFEISRLYVALRFRKVRESAMVLDDDDDDDDETNTDDDEPEAIDPAMKAKFLPMALMKAKKATGNDIWASLSSEEKNRLTELELRKMVPKS